ncbi:acetyl-CoA synthetase-like protein, partial [Saitoella complicata NRRL Y-17804]
LLTLPSLPLFHRAASHSPTSAAIAHRDGTTFTYSNLLSSVASFRRQLISSLSSLSGSFDHGDEEPRIAYLCESAYVYVVVQWAIWSVGGIAVPLCTAHPVKEMRYTLRDSAAGLVVASPLFESKIREVLDDEEFKDRALLITPTFTPTSSVSAVTIEEDERIDENQRAMIIYTSGTTGSPKGGVSTHATIQSQITSLVHAWSYTPSDRILHVLPLHHIHGVVNALGCVLWAGGCVEFGAPSPESLWLRWSDQSKPKLTLFMAVPTIYTRLITHAHQAHPDLDTKAACASFRLMISGSAALPTPTKKAWYELSGGKILLERYGMTEIGMALSCLATEDAGGREDGSVGWALPGVEVRLVRKDGAGDGEEFVVRDDEYEVQGEIQIRGPNVFKEYFRRASATRKEFTTDNFFRTGDIALRRLIPSLPERGGAYFIQGRESVDIIKSGGYKISALEVEREILQAELPVGVREVAVVGIPDAEWGQRVAALLILPPSSPTITIKQLRDVLRKELAPYKLPTVLKVRSTDESGEGGIKRNQMGKVNKKEVLRE